MSRREDPALCWRAVTLRASAQVLASSSRSPSMISEGSCDECPRGVQIVGCVLSALGHSRGERGPLRSFALRLGVRRLGRRSLLLGRIFGCVLSGLGRGGGNLSPSLLGRLPPSLLDRGSHLPSPFLGYVPPSLLARLRGGGGNLSREFLFRLAAGLPDSRRRLP